MFKTNTIFDKKRPNQGPVDDIHCEEDQNLPQNSINSLNASMSEDIKQIHGLMDKLIESESECAMNKFSMLYNDAAIEKEYQHYHH